MKSHEGWITEELPNSQRCLTELQGIQDKLKEGFPERFDIFDFGLDIEHQSPYSIEHDLVPLTRSSIWHAIALKAEFKLKLVYAIDGYLSAVERSNPFSTFLAARYLLELVATVSEVDFDLEDCVEIKLTEWGRRATAFHSVLYRARHTTSDEKHKAFFSRLGIPAHLFHPIKPGKAIKRLASRYGFASAPSLYHEFSNLSHQSGSGHKLLASDARVTNTIVLPNGRPIFLQEKVSVMTLAYPASDYAVTSLARTARVAWWSAKCANKILDEMRESPFLDTELRKLSNGRIKGAGPLVYGIQKDEIRKTQGKIGRNDLCPCGSSKRYKHCCLQKPLIS
ncbi:MAG TPA: SEC-C metal-binding domain-containing protein [Bradyrhizobium sp.]|nr:SEC-C metal-binding domain-containing protein [Bradyrhizobium sp.]